MRLIAVVLMTIGLCQPTLAQDAAPVKPAMVPSPQPPLMLKPHEAVHHGNELLKNNDPKAALDAYENAAKALPEAREIAFDEGLAQHALGNDDQARSSFGKAMADAPDALSDDALYSLGAIDHTEALAPKGDPKEKLSKLESAMEKYQEVLSHRPNHAEARDANQKAATYWRQIKQQMEQQKQQSKSDNQNKDDTQDQNQDQERADNQKQDPKQDQQQDQQNQQAQKQNNQSQQQDSDPSQSADQQKKDQQQQSAQAKNDDKNNDPQSQQAQAQKPEEKQDEKKDEQKQSEDQTAMITREQAERQLREMMQGMQDRNKLHREDAPVPAPSRSKDW